jgi:acyl-coenzyme A thioesterase PaaI-like protein
MHGGALRGPADVAEAVCASLNGPVGALPATRESSTHFLHAVRDRGAFATSRPLRAGKSAVSVEIDIQDDNGRLRVRVVQLVALRSAT